MSIHSTSQNEVIPQLHLTSNQNYIHLKELLGIVGEPEHGREAIPSLVLGRSVHLHSHTPSYLPGFLLSLETLLWELINAVEVHGSQNPIWVVGIPVLQLPILQAWIYKVSFRPHGILLPVLLLQRARTMDSPGWPTLFGCQEAFLC